MLKFGPCLQIGIVTDNLEESIKHYEMFGFTGWQKMPFDSDKLPGIIIDGGQGVLKSDIAVCNHDGLEIELIQPISEGAFMSWLREHGTGIHHIAFKKAGEYQEFMDEYDKLGSGNVIDVSDPTGTRGFTYLDTTKYLDFITEIHRGEPGKPGDHE